MLKTKDEPKKTSKKRSARGGCSIFEFVGHMSKHKNVLINMSRPFRFQIPQVTLQSSISVTSLLYTAVLRSDCQANNNVPLRTWRAPMLAVRWRSNNKVCTPTHVVELNYERHLRKNSPPYVCIGGLHHHHHARARRRVELLFRHVHCRRYSDVHGWHYQHPLHLLNHSRPNRSDCKQPPQRAQRSSPLAIRAVALRSFLHI